MSSRRKATQGDKALSTRSKKQIDSLSEHAKHIFEIVHTKAVTHYQKPAKRMQDKYQGAEFGQLIPWIPAKQMYKRQGDQWIKM